MSQILKIISTPMRGPPAAYPAIGRKKTKTGPSGLMATSPLLAFRAAHALQSTSVDTMDEDSLTSPATCLCTRIEHTGQSGVIHIFTHMFTHSFIHLFTHTFSLPPPLAHSLTHSLTPSLAHSLARSLARALAHPPTVGRRRSRSYILSQPARKYRCAGIISILIKTARVQCLLSASRSKTLGFSASCQHPDQTP